MAGSAAIPGYGSYFYGGTLADPPAADTADTKVAEVKGITGPGITGDDIDVTHTDSSDGYREFIPGLADSGEVSLDVNFTKAELALIWSYVRTERTYMVTFSDGSKWYGNGYVKGITNEAPLDGAITGTVTVKCSGKWVFAAVA